MYQSQITCVHISALGQYIFLIYCTLHVFLSGFFTVSISLSNSLKPCDLNKPTGLITDFRQGYTLSSESQSGSEWIRIYKYSPICCYPSACQNVIVESVEEHHLVVTKSASTRLLQVG